MQIIEAAKEVVDTAEAQGYRFTLRRVFYALVSAEIIPNTERAYKNLSATLDKARWEGLLRLDCLEDLGRTASIWESWEDPTDWADEMARRYRTDWWRNDDDAVEVWAEKQAVSSIVRPVCAEFGVTFLACRGFASLTAVVEAAERMERGTVFYVGDHDPSGLDMDRDLQVRLERLGADVELVRIALTAEQIGEHQLPPQPTKADDSRAFGYSLEHGGSWELDALPADVLAGLVRDAIESVLPVDFEDLREADEDHRARILEVVANL